MNEDQNNERTFTGSTWGGGFLHGKSKENDGMVGSEEGTFDPKTNELIRGRSVDPFGDLSVGSFKEGEIDCGVTKSQSGMNCVLHGKQTGPASSMDPKSCGCVGE